jgi:recombination protein RecT
MSNKTQAITISQKALSIQEMLNKNSSKIQKALPKTISVDKMISITMNSIRRNPRIAECTPISIFDCVMTSAQLGIPPDDIRGLAYIIPFNNRKKGIMEAQLMPGYKGYIHLAKESGEVKNVRSRVVYKNEPFHIQEGLNKVLEHTPLSPSERGEVKGAYTVVEFNDGRKDFTFMWEEDIQAIRQRSKAADSGPWITDPDEMRKKTTIRRAIKTLDLSPEINQAVAMDELFDTEKSIRNQEFDTEEFMVETLPGKPEVPEPKAIEAPVLSDSQKSEVIELMNEMGWDFDKQEKELRKFVKVGEKTFMDNIYREYDNYLVGKK